jgi:hypothetical protein
MKNRNNIVTKFEPFTPNSILLQNTHLTNLTLSNYCIKASLNSAYKNYTIDCDPANPNNFLGVVLNRGVRFLDFEIYSLAGQPIVGYSSAYDPTATNNEATNKTSDTFIQLSSVFKFILANKPSTITDPLFIQLRFKTTKTEIYKMIVNYIQQLFGGALFSGKITGNTLFSSIVNKIIFVVDFKNSNTSYQNSDLQKSGLVNLETGNNTIHVISTMDLIKSAQKRININTDGVTITANEKPAIWTLAYPDIMDTANPDIRTLMLNQCPNIIQCRFDYDDANLALYESLFINQGFVALGSAYKTALNS